MYAFRNAAMFAAYMIRCCTLYFHIHDCSVLWSVPIFSAQYCCPIQKYLLVGIRLTYLNSDLCSSRHYADRSS